MNLSDEAAEPLVLAGCNAAEVAAYFGVSRQVATATIIRVLRLYADPKPRMIGVLTRPSR